MSSLGRVLLAADGDDAHGFLEKECPWFAAVLKGEPAADPGQYCEGSNPAAVKLTPHTSEASTVVQPTVPPGGPGLFHMKGHHLPPYVEHLYKHLVGRYGKQGAYRVAVGVVKKWAAGVNPGGWKTKSGKGKRTHPDVRAAASKNVAEWEQEKSEAHARSRKSVKATVALAMPGVTTHPAMVPSPPLPPEAKLPTAAEMRQLARQVPDCVKAELSSSVRNHLEAAAVKLEKDDMLEALHVLRAAQAGIYSAHKADLGIGMPAVYTANASRVDVQSQANKAMIASRDREMKWRALNHGVALAIDKIRRKYYHGHGGIQQIGMFAAGPGQDPALGKVLRLNRR